MSEPIIKVENLSHRYGLQWAVKDIDFELTRNGVYGLLGANGAGKSTIMNVMCGVLKQTHGKVYIKGIDLQKNPVAAKRHIGFLPQQAPLQPELTVKEYLMHCAGIRRMDSAKIPGAVNEVMDKCGITNFRDRLLKNLSGGYQQRAGIAQAIIHKPDFVVLDEPTNGLDPNQILEVRGLIKEIAKERTVVLSTHILQEVQALCDDIWMINSGSIIFSGSLASFDSYIAPHTLIVGLASLSSIEDLKAIPEVLGAEALELNRYRVQFTDYRATVNKIVAASAANRWELLEIGVEKNSMETVFAELSKKQTN